MLVLSRRDAMRGAAALLLLVAACGKDNPTAPSPATPTGLTVTAAAPSNVALMWHKAANATGYTVQRAPGSTTTFAVVGTTADTTFNDPTVVGDSSYTYRVAATAGSAVSEYSATVSTRTPVPGPKVATVSGHIKSSLTWSADTTYVLHGFVQVDSGAILTIQPGTVIVGDTLVPGSSLWILRGAQLNAIGRADKPIVFTSERAAGNRAPGDWGGLVLIGRGVINRVQSGGQSSVRTRSAPDSAITYGGTDAADVSGQLKYVRVEFAGWSPNPDQEIDAVTSYGVGRPTKYEYIQSMASATDAFSFFGGSVDMHFLVSYEAGDDHFDWTEGFNGRGQFLIGYNGAQLTPRAGAASLSTNPHGFEGDNCDPATAGCTNYYLAPISMPVWANFTMVGPGTGVTLSGVTDNAGSVVRRGSGGTFINGVLTRWQGTGWSVRHVATDSMRLLDSLAAYNVYLSDNGGGNFDATDACDNTADGGRCGTKAKYPAMLDGTEAASTMFVGLPASGSSPAVTDFDWTPTQGSTIATGGAVAVPNVAQPRLVSFYGGPMPLTSYIGAAPPGGPRWWEGWTVYYRN